MRLSPGLQHRSVEDGAFTVSVWAEQLDHDGFVAYDDDRDTVPDREAESIGLGAFEFAIQYDSARLRLVKATLGPFLEASERSFQCLERRDDGEFAFGCVSRGASPPGPDGTFALADVEFVPIAAGSAVLALEAELAGPLGDDILVDVEEGGAVQITGSGKVAPPSDPDATNEAEPSGPAGGTVPPSGPDEPNGSSSPTPGSNPSETAVGPRSQDGTPAASRRVRQNPGVGDEESEASAAADESSGGDGIPWLAAVTIGGLLGLGVLGVLTVAWRQRA